MLSLPVGREASPSVGSTAAYEPSPGAPLLYQLSPRGFIAIVEQQLS